MNIKKYGAPSVKKAFAILSAISSSKDGMGVSDLAKKTSCLFAHSQTPGCAFCDINPSNLAE